MRDTSHVMFCETDCIVVEESDGLPLIPKEKDNLGKISASEKCSGKTVYKINGGRFIQAMTSPMLGYAIHTNKLRSKKKPFKLTNISCGFADFLLLLYTTLSGVVYAIAAF